MERPKRRQVREYTVVLTREAGVYNVSVPALPGCFTWGRSKRHALAHAREAVALYLETLEAAGESIPVEEDLHRIRVG